MRWQGVCIALTSLSAFRMALLCTSFLPYRADDVGGIKISLRQSIHRIPTPNFFFAASARVYPIVSTTLVSMTTAGYAEVYGKLIALITGQR